MWHTLKEGLIVRYTKYDWKKAEDEDEFVDWNLLLYTQT